MEERIHCQRLFQVESQMLLPLMTDFIGRYHTKICGVPLLDHTQEFIRQTVQTTFSIDNNGRSALFNLIFLCFSSRLSTVKGSFRSSQ